MAVLIPPVIASDEAEFLAAAQRSRVLHRPWVQPSVTSEAFAAYLERFDSRHHFGFLISVDGEDAPVGVVNLTNVISGAFC
jgi:ribosomal-protein-alanine N-acetyltransferase